MIVSHKHKFIFIKTHKTAGTSLQIALSKHCGEKDIISKLYKGDTIHLLEANGKDFQNTSVPLLKYNRRDWFQYLFRSRKQHFTEHNAISYLKRWLGNEVWNNYYKFCVERDPFEKIVSYYYWRTRDIKMSFDTFLDKHLYGLSDFHIYSDNQIVGVDKVYKYGDLDNVIAKLEHKFNFDIDMENIKAKSTYSPKNNKLDKANMTDKQKTMILNEFSNEIEHFYPQYL
ncbi:MAG: sulfotransferase family 2 domain-containing protein [Saprospiraceae bacterium]